jgi:hypothetical protein
MSLNALLANHEDVTSDLIPEYIKTAPESVRRRIRALKKLQLKTVNIQGTTSLIFSNYPLLQLTSTAKFMKSRPNSALNLTL